MLKFLNMEITGHSLGGAMVDVFLADNEKLILLIKNYKELEILLEILLEIK